LNLRINIRLSGQTLKRSNTHLMIMAFPPRLIDSSYDGFHFRPAPKCCLEGLPGRLIYPDIR
jgi:hypothetical protein